MTSPVRASRSEDNNCGQTTERDRQQAQGGRQQAPGGEMMVTRNTRRTPIGNINKAPLEKLNVYVFGEGSSGELGLGSKGQIIDVKRPRVNGMLSATKVGVVQLAAGGMHAAALTHNNRILTWGVNDEGALGRDTKHEENLRGIDDDNSDCGSDNGLNPIEALPTEVSLENVPAGTIWTSLAAGDSTTMAVTSEGKVYGCGTFRSNEGILGFSADTLVQNTLILVPRLRNITKVVCGANHCIAIDNRGTVQAWGSGQQNQLGRRVIERTRVNGLIPRGFGLPKNGIAQIATGSYHSFAIDKNGGVWAWGLNSYGETGCVDDVGEDGAVVPKPTRVATLADKNIVSVSGGAHHSIAVTAAGEMLGFGRMDGAQLGVDPTKLPPSSIVKDDKGVARILAVPTPVPGVPEAVVFVASGSDHNLAITITGKPYTWGFSVSYQTGLGTTDDVASATLVDNTAVRGTKLVWAGAGGQFGMFASQA